MLRRLVPVDGLAFTAGSNLGRDAVNTDRVIRCGRVSGRCREEGALTNGAKSREKRQAALAAIGINSLEGGPSMPETRAFRPGVLEPSTSRYFNVFVRWANDDRKYELYAGDTSLARAAEVARGLLLSGAATVYLVETQGIGLGVQDSA